MIYKHPKTGFRWMFALWAGVCPRFGDVLTTRGPLKVRGKPSDKPERGGGLFRVITQRWNVKKA